MANALKWSVDLDTSGVQKNLNKAKASLNSFGKQSIGALVAPLAGVVGAVGSVAAVMKGLSGALDLGAEMEDLSIRTGIAVDQLMVLRKAFKFAGVDAENLGPAVGKMQKYLAEAASGGSGGSLLKKMGLDPKELASMDPGKAFRAIGEHINSLQNPTERAAVAMAIFGRAGATLLPVFAELNNVKMDNTALLLGKNAAAFKVAHNALESVGGKLQGFFIGMASSFVPAILPLLKKFQSMDFSGWGQQLGNVIGNFATNFKSELDAIGNALQKGVSSMFTANFWEVEATEAMIAFSKLGDFLINVFKTPIDYLQAAIEKMMEDLPESLGGGSKAKSAKASYLAETEQGNKFAKLGNEYSDKGNSEAAQRAWEKSQEHYARASEFDKQSKPLTLEETYQDIHSRKNNLEYLTAGNEKNRAVLEALEKAAKDRLGKAISEAWKPVLTATGATNAANAEGRAAAEKEKPNGGPFDASLFPSVFADSLAKIGGGGNSVGGGGNPILEENRRQTGILQQIRDGLLKSSSGGFTEAQFSGSVA